MYRIYIIVSKSSMLYFRGAKKFDTFRKGDVEYFREEVGSIRLEVFPHAFSRSTLIFSELACLCARAFAARDLSHVHMRAMRMSKMKKTPILTFPPGLRRNEVTWDPIPLV